MAAKYLGVAPWDLYSRPLLWVEQAELQQRVDAAEQEWHERQSRAGQGS